MTGVLRRLSMAAHACCRVGSSTRQAVHGVLFMRMRGGEQAEAAVRIDSKPITQYPCGSSGKNGCKGAWMLRDGMTSLRQCLC
jgi:hypothetical protein